MSERLYSIVGIPSLQTTTATTTLSSALDMSVYTGKILFILNCLQATAGTTPTNTVTITECDTAGGTYTAVTDGAFTVATDASGNVHEAVELSADTLQRYVKVKAVTAGTNTPTFQFGVSVVGRKKYG